MRRRDLQKLGLSAGLSFAAGCPSTERFRSAPIEVACRPADGDEVDYVVIGSGAGGGPVACNLARAGHTVVLLEAGSDPPSWTRSVPALHAASVEDPELRWDFFVRTYDDDGRQARSDKLVRDRGGILYPRAGTLGGCTAHNALITIYPHDEDWNAIARTFDDPSWSAKAMRRYFERLEHCDYAPRPSSAGAPNPARHGFDGWLHTQTASPWLAVGDGRLLSIIEAAVRETGDTNPSVLADVVRQVLTPDRALWDPNDARVGKHGAEGMVFVPLHMNNGARTGTREYILATMEACRNNLTLILDALACRVVLDEDQRAVGVEYAAGARLYRASPSPDLRADTGERRFVRARREVILCGGVFNSPQLLMLSGIGPREHLERHGITTRVDLPGVGKNLQDRYEIGVVSEMDGDFAVLDGARLKAPDPNDPDPALRKWWFDRTGPYATNGVVGALIKKSRPRLRTPDLFLFGLVGNFRGYYPGFSRDLVADHRHFTWGVLKAHTRNTAGEVLLRSADPRDVPDVRFRYFEEGSDGWNEDLDAVVEGVVAARRIMRAAGTSVVREVLPGPKVRSRAEIADFVRANAWGHHASCTNKMGPASDPLAVVDQRFRVHGTRGLRVVDASVFPRIPGFFIVTSVYMIAEKASDAILADAG